MNASDFLMSSIVVGLAALGGYGQEVRAEPPAEIATAVEQPVEASGEATEEMRAAKKAAGEPYGRWRGAYRRYGDNDSR